MKAVLFALLAGIFAAWVLLVSFLHARIKKLHPRAFATMGRPELFWTDGTSPGFNAFTFVFKRAHKPLHDRALRVLSDFMAAFVILFVCLLLFGFASIWIGF